MALSGAIERHSMGQDRDYISPFYTTPEAAALIGVKPDTLKKMRYKSKGPKYRRHFGSIVYFAEDLLIERKVRAAQGLFVPDIDEPLEDIVEYFREYFG